MNWRLGIGIVWYAGSRADVTQPGSMLSSTKLATMSIDTTIKRAELIVSSELVDETVMMNVEKSV